MFKRNPSRRSMFVTGLLNLLAGALWTVNVFFRRNGEIKTIVLYTAVALIFFGLGIVYVYNAVKMKD